MIMIMMMMTLIMIIINVTNEMENGLAILTK